jgi:hypothetical protein
MGHYGACVDVPHNAKPALFNRIATGLAKNVSEWYLVYQYATFLLFGSPPPVSVVSLLSLSTTSYCGIIHKHLYISFRMAHIMPINVSKTDRTIHRT